MKAKKRWTVVIMGMLALTSLSFAKEADKAKAEQDRLRNADTGVAKDIPETKGLIVFTLRERSSSPAIFVFPVSAGGRCAAHRAKEIGNREAEQVSWFKDACRCRS